MMIKKLILFAYSFFILTVQSFCQKNILVEVSIDNKPIKVLSKSYILIELNELLFCDSSYIESNDIDILYNLTRCGGYYVKKRMNPLSTKGCCELGDVQKFMNAYSKDTLKYGNLKEYMEIEFINLDDLSKHKAYTFSSLTKNERIKCIVSIYGIDLDYCLCPMGAGMFDFYVYNPNKVCYIKQIKNIYKLKRQLRVQIKNKVNKIISNEQW